MTVAAPAVAAPAVAAPAVPAARASLLPHAVGAALFAVAGLVLVSAVTAVAIVDGMLARGVVVLEAGDVALVRSVAPMAALLVLLGASHLVAAVGVALGSRTLAAFGIGLGALDVAAGLLTLVALALTPGAALDGVAIGVVAILAGTVLAVAARAAEWGVAAVEA